MINVKNVLKNYKANVRMIAIRVKFLIQTFVITTYKSIFRNRKTEFNLTINSI